MCKAPRHATISPTTGAPFGPAIRSPGAIRGGYSTTTQPAVKFADLEMGRGQTRTNADKSDIRVCPCANPFGICPKMGSSTLFICDDHVQDLSYAVRRRLLACGSMVLPIISVFCFALYERKTKHKR